MHRAQAELLLDIMAVEFTAVDLNLFLDTHPRSKEALDAYNMAVHRLTQLRDRYEEKYGPIVNFGLSPERGEYWRYLDEPWPWEVNFAKMRGF